MLNGFLRRGKGGEQIERREDEVVGSTEKDEEGEVGKEAGREKEEEEALKESDERGREVTP